MMETTTTAIEQASQLPPIAKMELLEAMMLRCDQLDVPLQHLFAHGVYMRMGTIPKHALLVGHMHKTDHLNVLLKGRVSIFMDGTEQVFVGPCVFKASAGVRKLIYAHEDSTLANIHGTHETDLEKIEDELIVKSETSTAFKNGEPSDLMQLAKSIGEGQNQKEALTCLLAQS